MQVCTFLNSIIKITFKKSKVLKTASNFKIRCLNSIYFSSGLKNNIVKTKRQTKILYFIYSD